MPAAPASAAPEETPLPASHRSGLRVPATMIGTLIRHTGRAAGRIPATLSTAGLLLAAGIVTGTLWAPADPRLGWLHELGYGTPAVQDGRLWAFPVGAFVFPRPELYLLTGVLLVAVMGWYERRTGGLRAVAALLGTQLAGTIGTAVLLLPLDGHGWKWAAALADERHLGLSAGLLGLVGAGTALVAPAMGRRIRALGLTFLAVLVLKSGLLWDLEHLIAFGAGLVAGPTLAGRRRQPIHRPHFTAIQIRIAVALFISMLAVANVVETIYPGLGGMFGAGQPTHAPLRGLGLVLGELVVALLVCDALRRGRAAAWWLASMGAAAVLVNSLLNTRGAAQIADAVSAAAVLAVLLRYRNAWRWRTPDGFARRSLLRVAIAVLAFGSAWLVSIWVLRSQLDPVAGWLDAVRETMTRFTFSPGPLRPRTGAARTVFAVLGTAWAVAMIGLLIPWLYTDRGPVTTCREALGTLLRRHGGGSLGWMRTWPAFTTWTTRDGELAISYCVVGTVAIAIGDPVGPAERFSDAVREFRAVLPVRRLDPHLVRCHAALVGAAGGWRSTQIGEDTVLQLAGLEFIGKTWQDVRTARNRAAREGITMLDRSAGRLPRRHCGPQIGTGVNRNGSAGKSLPEMGFTLGTIEHALDPEMRTHIAVDEAGTVQGVTTWLPVHEDGRIVGWTLDLMRRRPDGFRPVMEYLIAESAMAFKAEGYADGQPVGGTVGPADPADGRPHHPGSDAGPDVLAAGADLRIPVAAGLQGQVPPGVQARSTWSTAGPPTCWSSRWRSAGPTCRIWTPGKRRCCYAA